MSSYQVHIVCSSGGVRCFSYIGAIRKLLEHNIGIASISSCSMGSVIGSLVAAGLSIDEVEQHILNFDFSILKKRKWYWPLKLRKFPFAICEMPDYAHLLEELIGKDITLSEMKIPFSTAALDIRQRQLLAYASHTHGEMRLSEVLRIATAIPPLYEPYKKDKRLLVDAAVASESPVWMAANYPGNHPIIVLKPDSGPDESYRKKFQGFLAHLFNASAGSHDHFNITQIPRAIEVKINCGNTRADYFKIGREEKETLIQQGQDEMEACLKAYGYELNHILEVEEIGAASSIHNTADRAAMVAGHMISRYHNEASSRNQVFISYSKKDRDWLMRLQTFMRSIERFTGIKTWDDTNIQPGVEWQQEIERALAATKVAVMLVTPSFLASEFIQEREMGYFLEVSKRENVAIVWVAVSSSLYEETPLSAIQCANNPQYPLDQLQESEQNALFTKICQEIIKAMDK